jgi:hypothetical protein
MGSVHNLGGIVYVFLGSWTKSVWSTEETMNINNSLWVQKRTMVCDKGLCQTLAVFNFYS